MKKLALILFFSLIFAPAYSLTMLEGGLLNMGFSLAFQEKQAFNSFLQANNFETLPESTPSFHLSLHNYIEGLTFGVWTDFMTFNPELANFASDSSIRWNNGGHFIFSDIGWFGAAGVDVGLTFVGEDMPLIMTSLIGVAVYSEQVKLIRSETEERPLSDILEYPGDFTQINSFAYALTFSFQFNFQNRDNWYSREFRTGTFMRISYAWEFSRNWNYDNGVSAVPLSDVPDFNAHQFTLVFGHYLGEAKQTW